ncbi:Transposase [Ferriphaselus amnicola]|uniref:Transposase n=1 Tax=Ferriphaselus amnicola TaxID=1188319 RepID=A0A2Z6GBR9_9PROT|nr:Transposase [Ferriphaselus amnicola]
MSIITIGIDLAKNVFAVHGVNEAGRAELIKPKVSRDQLLPLIAQLPPCVIGMEACTGAHHWARQFRQFGHTVRLIAPKFVTSTGGGKPWSVPAYLGCMRVQCGRLISSRLTNRAFPWLKEPSASDQNGICV